MSQIFSRSANTLSRLSIFGVVSLVAGLLTLGLVLVRSSYVTGVGVYQPQPVQFSHEHHTNDIGIDCRYCHTSVEDSYFANIPGTQVCMNCHSQIWSNSEYLEPVRESWATGEPLVWSRVHDVPDYTYFNHSIHVQKGFGCETCHGRVDQMPLTAKSETMQMEWCLDCHRNPAQYVRPREEVFTMGYEPAEPQAVLGPRLVQEYNIQSKLDCSICHR